MQQNYNFYFFLQPLFIFENHSKVSYFYSLLSTFFIIIIMLAAEHHRKKRRILYYVVIISFLQLMTWASATSRAFPPQGGNHDAFHQDQRPMFLPHSLSSKQDSKSIVNQQSFRGLSTIGSRPPNCDHKCGGCVPCEAIQVPTTNDKVRVQYANYEPEGWKCKCGSSFYSP